MSKISKQVLLETARQKVLGFSTKEIANNLDVSTHTVRNYIRSAEKQGWLAKAEDERGLVYEAMYEARRIIADKAFKIASRRLDSILAQDEIDAGQLDEALKVLEKTEHVGKNEVPGVAVQQNTYITPGIVVRANEASRLLNAN